MEKTIVTAEYMDEIQDKLENLYCMLDTKNKEPLTVNAGGYRYRIGRFSKIEYKLSKLLVEELEHLEKLKSRCEIADDGLSMNR